MARLTPAVYRLLYDLPYALPIERWAYKGGSNDGIFGPSAPIISGLTLAWDFDFGPEPLGPMQAEITTRDGSETNALIHPLTGSLVVDQIAPGRRALTFDATYSTVVRILGGHTPFNEANPDFTLVVVFHRGDTGADQTLWDQGHGFNSLTTGEAFKHLLRISSSNTLQWGRSGNGIINYASLGTPSTTTANVFVGRGSLSADNISRGMQNGGTKASTAARDNTETESDVILLGAKSLWSNSGTTGYTTSDQFFDGKLERVLCYTGSATDGDLDTLQTWAEGYYV